MRRTIGLLAMSSFVLTLLTVVPASAAPAGVPGRPADPRLGHGSSGLVSARDAKVPHCPDRMLVARESQTCVHGADRAPQGVDVTTPRSVEELRETAYDAATPASVAGSTTPSTDGSGQIVCEGDGVSGKRVQVLYLRTTAVSSRFAVLRDALEQNVVHADAQFNASAAQTGGARHVRFVTVPDGSGGCALDLREVVIPAPADGNLSFGYTISELKKLGYSSSSRKYLMLTDASYLCGIGTFYGDDRPGSDNVSNWYAPEYSRVDTGCWHYAEAHELMHNLGGVQDSAPHSSLAGHCYDGDDDMCYSDGGPWFLGPDGLPGTSDDRGLLQTCLPGPLSLFDCNHDDYFHTHAAEGSYLATHWNTADSAYLINPGDPVQAALPGAPTGAVAKARDGGATVTFTPPTDDGGATVTGYTVTASTGQKASGSGSPIVLSGLSNNVLRSFTVRATNSTGTGPASSASNAVTFWSSTLTIAGGTSVVAGSAATLSGTLTTGAPGGRSLTLTSTPAGQPARTQSVTTASDGHWSVTVKPVYTTTFTIRYAGDATHRSATSSVATVTARTKVTLTSPTNGTRTTTRTVRVTGTTSPNKAGKVVHLYEVTSTGSLAWRASAVVASNGTFAVTKWLGKGTHKLVVTIGATSSNASGKSGTLTVHEI